MNADAIGGAAARKDPRRDCWRTPAKVSSLVRNHLLCTWDATVCGVELLFLRKRVAYEPPPGIKKSSPAFDSCLILRGGA